MKRKKLTRIIFMILATVMLLQVLIPIIASAKSKDGTVIIKDKKLPRLDPGKYELTINHKEFGKYIKVTVYITENEDIIIKDQTFYDFDIKTKTISFTQGDSYDINRFLPIYGNNDMGLTAKVRNESEDIDITKLPEDKLAINVKLDGKDYKILEKKAELNAAIKSLSVGNHKDVLDFTIELKSEDIILGYLNEKISVNVAKKPETKPEDGNTGGNTGGGSTGGGSTGGGSTGGNTGGETKPIVPEQPKVEFELNKVNHVAYLNGYKDQTIRPEGSLTREEAAMVLYRVMDSTFRSEMETNKHSFTDVEGGRWSEKAIATLVKAEILTGYEDGTFKPTKQISRAELATMIDKIEGNKLVEGNFPDVVNHWATHYINSVASKGYINGYEDGTFKPNNLVKRSEFATMMNKALNRSITKANILPGIKEFKDLQESKWYYEAMVEATNEHKHTIENGQEVWTELVK